MTSSSLSENFSTTSLIFYNLVTGLLPKKVNLPSDLFSSGLGSKTGKICVKKEQYTCLSRHTLIISVFWSMYHWSSKTWEIYSSVFSSPKHDMYRLLNFKKSIHRQLSYEIMCQKYAMVTIKVAPSPKPTFMLHS